MDCELWSSDECVCVCVSTLTRDYVCICLYISSPYLLVFGYDRVTRYTGVDNVAGDAGEA